MRTLLNWLLFLLLIAGVTLLIVLGPTESKHGYGRAEIPEGAVSGAVAGSGI